MPGIIKIKGEERPVRVSDDVARKLKITKYGRLPEIPPSDPNDEIDLGDKWSGKLKFIDSIVIESDSKEKPPDPPLTPVEKENLKETLRKHREECIRRGLIKEKKERPTLEEIKKTEEALRGLKK